MHIPVLLNEVISNLNPQPNQNFIDCTLGDGGHSLAILEKTSPNGKVLGIDLDKESISNFRSSIQQIQKQNPKSQNLEKRLILVNDNFANLKKIVENLRQKPKYRNLKFYGILLDLGLSSSQLSERKKGFSFLKDEPLIMRYDWNKSQDSKKLLASDIINNWPERKIEEILRKYGEEKHSKTIAKTIIKQRKTEPIKTTRELVEIIKKAIPDWYQHQRIHFATKTFQALRIAVNRELENLEKVLPQAIEILEPKGRLVIISYHSLEDRINKDFLKKESKNCLCPPSFPKCICHHKASLKIITKKPIVPIKEEIKKNPRSRSAKMRIGEKLSNLAN